MSRSSAFVLAAVLLAAVPSHADSEAPYVPPDFLAVTPALPRGQDGPTVWRLDLAEVRRIALKQNLDIALERTSVRATDLGQDIARGAFEPVVTAGYAHDDNRSPPSSRQEGAAGEILTFQNDSWRIGIAQRFSTGTQVELNFSNGRAESSLGTAVEPLNVRSGLTLGIAQPLLRGFSTDLVIPRLEILRARIASERQRSQLAVAMADLVERAENAYWSVLQSIYRYDLALRSLKLATDQLALTRRQIEAGTLPPSDLIGAESTLAERELALLLGEQEIQATSDQLRAVLNLPREQWSRPILPTDVPSFGAAAIGEDAALAQAIKSRPELAQMNLDLEETVLALRSAENAKLPQLDLGLQGNVVGQDSGYVGALSQVSSFEARGWSVMLNFTWTPLRRASRAAAEIAQLRAEQTRTRQVQLVQKVWAEVRDAVRNQLSAERQVKAAARFRQLAELSLDVEQRRFLNGQSSNIVVAQRQEAVATSRSAELAALLAHNRATLALLRATGRLLPERRIEIQVATPS